MIDPLQKYDITHQHYLWSMEPEHHPVKKESSSTIVYVYIFIYQPSIFGFQAAISWLGESNNFEPSSNLKKSGTMVPTQTTFRETHQH